MAYPTWRSGQAADEDTIYSICSISKLFTAIAVMQQRDLGRLSLRDPVAHHLPWFDMELAHADQGPARIRGLLTHSSGLPRESDFPYWVDADFPFPTREEIIERLAQQQTLYPADTRYQYSNLGLTLAGEIVAKVADQPYGEYVRQEILDPLGMSDTRPFLPTELHGKQMAVGYSGFGRNRTREPVPPFDTRGIGPAAGFTSTVSDLAAFARWQFRTLAGEDSVLDPNTLREMQRVAWVDPNWKVTAGIGFGVIQRNGDTRVGHGGACPGYITSFNMFPKHKIAAIALTNAGDGPAGYITDAMLKQIGDALRKAEKAKPEPAEQTVALTEYSGNYSSAHWGGETAVRVWGDKLALIRLPARTIGDIDKLKRVEGDVFVRIDKDGEEREPVEFVRDDAGAVMGMKVHSNVYRRI